jgi:ribose transport system substrate-binding protein
MSPIRVRSMRLLGLAMALAAMVIFVACGSSDDGGDDTSAAETTAAETTTADSGAESGAEPLVEVPTEGDEMVDTEKWKKDPPWTIGYSDASLSNSWRVFAWQYMQAEAAAHPEIKEIIHTNANDSTPKQVSDIENLVSRNVDCLIVAATSATALNPAIAAASQQVPVVINERAVETGDYTSFAALDAVGMGRQQAQAVVDILGGKGKIVILQGVEGAGPVVESLQGMQEVLDENPDIEVIATEYTNWSRDEGKKIMENLLQANDQIDAVLSDSGLQNVGAFEAAKAAGRLDEIKAWSGDTVQGWLRIVDENKLPGIIVDRPTIVGANSVATCVAILKGEPVPKVWPTPNQEIKAEDVAEYIAPNTPGSEEWWDWWNLPEEWLPGNEK